MFFGERVSLSYKQQKDMIILLGLMNFPQRPKIAHQQSKENVPVVKQALPGQQNDCACVSAFAISASGCFLLSDSREGLFSKAPTARAHMPGLVSSVHLRLLCGLFGG